MKKKMALTAAAVALVGTLAVGGTLAWFTDTETATNVVTMGEVDITLSENGGEDGVTSKDGLQYNDVMPGDTFDKVVTINNLEQAAFVRAKITVDGLEDLIGENDENIKFMKDGKELTLTFENGVAIVDPWEMKAEDGEGAYELFDSIQVPDSWGNKFVNANFSIKVDVEAVQQANLTIDNAFDSFNETVVPDLKDEKPNLDAVGTVAPTEAETAAE